MVCWIASSWYFRYVVVVVCFVVLLRGSLFKLLFCALYLAVCLEPLVFGFRICW